MRICSRSCEPSHQGCQDSFYIVGEWQIGTKAVTVESNGERILEWEPTTARLTLHTEFECLFIRRGDDAKPDVECASVKQAHAKSCPPGSRYFHGLIHKPEASASVEEIIKPNSCRLVLTRAA